MGKGFNNYMTKKFFHPASKDNIKRVWMAKQKTDFEKKKQEDLMAQYQREQEMLSNRALLGDEKAKMGLSFLYDAPPGMKSKEKEDDEPEYKFEWQRKYNAPREAYAKGDDTISDQPFGIEVRNIRCIKCRQWGHVNTDKICPLFGKNLTAEPPKPETSTSSLLDSLKEDGFQLKESMLGRFMASSSGEAILAGDEEDDPEVQFLKSLTSKQKKKLLKKLNSLQEKNGAGKHGKSKKDKKKKKSKKKRSHDSDDSDSSDEGQRRKHKKRIETSSGEEDYKAQGARPKKLKREHDTDNHRSRKHQDRESSDSDFDSQKRKRSVNNHKRSSIKHERHSQSPISSRKRREKREVSSSDSDSSVDSLPKKSRHRDRADRHSRDHHSPDKHSSRRERSRSPITKRDGHRKNQSRSPPPRYDRDRSSSRDRQGKQGSKKNRDSR